MRFLLTFRGLSFLNLINEHLFGTYSYLSMWWAHRQYKEIKCMVLALEKTIVYLEEMFRSNKKKYMIKYPGLIGNNTWCRVSKEIVYWRVLE